MKEWINLFFPLFWHLLPNSFQIPWVPQQPEILNTVHVYESAQQTEAPNSLWVAHRARPLYRYNPNYETFWCGPKLKKKAKNIILFDGFSWILVYISFSLFFFQLFKVLYTKYHKTWINKSTKFLCLKATSTPGRVTPTAWPSTASWSTRRISWFQRMPWSRSFMCSCSTLIGLKVSECTNQKIFTACLNIIALPIFTFLNSRFVLRNAIFVKAK